MFEMRKVALLVLALLAACSPTPTAVATVPVPSDDAIPTPTPQAAMPTPQIVPTVPGAPETSGLWLQILAPLDEAVVSVPQVDVTGSAPAGAVISINDVILIVDSSQQFTATVPLEEGPNLIEIVASDENGNELSTLLTVVYEP